MTSVTLEGVTKSFGDVVAVNDVSLEIEDGEFVTLVGPSGCGKTTTLRLIAGLEESNDGRILFGDRDVTKLPARNRNVGMIFQNLALYPHMSVRENMEFGLDIAGVDQAEQESRITETAEMLDIGDLLDRPPGELSGGQQQRVAMGRTLVLDPAVFLLDEPLSDLDAKLRSQIRTELLRLHDEVGVTTIYVTHDQRQAMTMSDRVIVMKDGEVQQFGSPETIYHSPNNEFVGHFVGTPSMNFYPFAVRHEDGTSKLDLDFTRIGVDGALDGYTQGRTGRIGIRPEDVEVESDGTGFVATARLIEMTGSRKIVHFECGEAEVTAILPEDREITKGEQYSLSFPADKLHFFDDDDQTIGQKT